MRQLKTTYFLICVAVIVVMYMISYDNNAVKDEMVLLCAVVFSVIIFFLFVNPFAGQSEALLAMLKVRAGVSKPPVEQVVETLSSQETVIRISSAIIDQMISQDKKTDTYIPEALQDHALIRSVDNLRTHLATLAEKDKEAIWMSASMARFIEILKASYKSDNDFYDTVLTNLVKAVGAHQGALFVLKHDDEGSFLELNSCYAYHRKKFVDKRVEIGDGLIGQVFLEGSTMIMTQVPESYLSITSGLGESLPRFVAIIPFKLNQNVECVLELAAFDMLPNYKINFVEKVGESIASAISNNRTAGQMRKLLAESQTYTEQLASQEEEMRQNMEELEATQEEMKRKEGELIRMLESSAKQQQQLKENMNEVERLKEQNERYKADVVEILNAIPAKIFLKDKEGNMVLCNQAVAMAYDLSIDKLIGTHDRDHFDASQAREFRNQELEVMRAGLQTYVQEERLNGQLRFFRTTKLPFFIHHLNQTGLLGFQFDVTDSYREKAISF
jgi:PAS domain-containing protein